MSMTRRSLLQASLVLPPMLVVGAAFARNVAAQGAPPAGGPGGPGGAPGGDTTLTDAFKGITTNGTLIPDLYTIQPTGMSTAAVRQAAESFLAGFTDEQRASMMFAIDDDEWRKWSNVDGYQRQGIQLQDMTDDQRTAGYGLLQSALSTKGYQLSRDIMRLNTTEGEMMNRLTQFNENLYYFTVMGTPSASDPWGFQLDGHHLVINYLILGDQVVMTPVFMGAEPPVAPSGTYQGLAVLQTEQDKGLAMVNALTGAQQSTAIIQTSKTGDNNLTEAFKDNVVLDYAGINAADLSPDQQTQLLDLIGEWVGNMDDGHAAVKMDEVKAHLNDTYFAWIGATDANAVFYYRIQSRVLLVEFDHESPGPLGNALNYPQTPSRSHIHSVVRAPNGNDYGKDLLRQHLLTVAH